MKKSKIIVPALGILLLSTAASISGTVAWFTASRTFSTQVGEVGVASIDGNLSGVVAGNVGTKEAKSEGSAVNDKILFQNADGQPSVLTDASYNDVTSSKMLYTDEPIQSEANNGVNTSKFLEVGTEGNSWKAASKTVETVTTNYYYAVSWDITLTYTYAAVENDVHIFLDKANSTFSSQLTLKTGFRLCLEDSQLTNSLVYAPFSEDETISHVSSTTGTTATTNVIKSNTSVTPAADNLSAAAAKEVPGYLGTVTKASNSLSIHVVCWLEGLDANVITANIDAAKVISGTLAFYCRNALAA